MHYIIAIAAFGAVMWMIDLIGGEHAAEALGLPLVIILIFFLWKFVLDDLGA